jgi:outer membrane protein
MSAIRPLFRALPVFVTLLAGSAAHADTKIGYFDVKRILAEVDEAKAAKSRLEEDFKRKQKQLDDQKNELEKAQRDFQAQSAVMTQAAKEQRQAELMQKLQDAQRTYMELQQDLAGKEQKALGDLLQRLEPVVTEIANAEGFTYVFEKNESGMFHGPSSSDLTAQVIRKYNQLYPAKGGAKKGGK